MPQQRKTQKEFAKRYLTNLRYSRVYRILGRMWMTLSLLALLVATLVASKFIEFGRTDPRLEQWNSPGPISQAHSGIYNKADGLTIAMDCKKCHDLNPKVNPLDEQALNASLSKNCESCHAQHTFHQEDVVKVTSTSCVDCHHEHQGTGPMKAVADVNCAICHANKDVMDKSQQLSVKMGNPPGAIAIAGNSQDVTQINAGNPPKPFAVKISNVVYFQPPNSNAVFTPFKSFDGDHPEFQIHREKLVDLDTLKFGHKFHLSLIDPRHSGMSNQKLSCDYCHQVDSQGAYMQKISFQNACMACHQMSIDKTLPGLHIPHPTEGGSITSVRDFVLTLPTQYASYANAHPEEFNTKGPVPATQVARFVNQHLTSLGWPNRTADELVNDVYYADARAVYLNGVPSRRATFPGCLECHDVKPGDGQPVVTRPVIPDRWEAQANFNHNAHSHMSCMDCHNAAKTSTQTSDILLPDKASCVACHSAKGMVVNTCVTCHTFHNTPPSGKKNVEVETASYDSLRSMMLAKHE